MIAASRSPRPTAGVGIARVDDPPCHIPHCPPSLALHPSMHRYTDPQILVELGRALQRRNYRFVCPTPSTQAIVLARPHPPAPDLRDIFGWNRPFEARALDAGLFGLVREADLLEPEDGKWRSRVRFSTADDLLFAHSAFPTVDRDAVFFGPDTYRFIAFIKRALGGWSPRSRVPRILDLGCGSGAGGLVAAGRAQGGFALSLADVNARALPFAQANAALAGQRADVVESDLFDRLDGRFDLILMNPPCIADSRERACRHGGGDHGMALPVRMVEQAVARLNPRGLLLAYTGTPIIGGRDCFWDGAQAIARTARSYAYDEVDPDIFGEELANEAYAEADRIAAVTLRVEG
jgi:SAM-dependent methyltransferase